MIMTAQQVLDKYWNGSIPVNPNAIAKEVGISVFKAKLPDTYSGIIWKNPKIGRIEIITNEKHHSNRRRFTIAHELGHYFSTEEFDGQIDDAKDLLMFNRDNHSTPEEIAANRFAAELLMPEYAVKYAIIEKSLTTITKLANLFEVSESAMNVRLISLGIIHG